MSLDKGHYYNYQVQHKMLTSNNNTAKDCLSFIPRDETPPKLRKYRSNQEPGKEIKNE